ncbi:MAG: peptidylprolyl isomerase [Bacteroidota bacterium]|nr:peptidylprolyl isomerase [Bacteroidota bacterium]MDP3147246.1 peptidylprolyl isomerase [Bacteroidota bacterium]
MIKKITLATLISFFTIGENFSQTATYTYTGKPRFQILTKRNNATLGIINVELFPNIAPKHTRNFDSLVSKQFYDTTAFHRVIPGFMIQGGDPNSRHGPKPTWGQGQFGQPTVNAEFTAAKHVRGILSAARSSNINSATSQFFICHATAASLNGQYSVYGRVTSGINFVDTIVNAPRDANNNPLVKIEMFVTYIGSNDTIPNPPNLTSPANNAINVDTLAQVLLKWNAVSDGIIYHVDVSTDSTFAIITNSVNTGNLLFVFPSGLPSNTKYFWRVKTNNGGHFSTFSPVWRFTTIDPNYGVGIQKNTSTINYPLIYPNPSTGKFTFSDLEKGNIIEIFDITGKLILEVIAKENLTIIDLEGKEKGVYTYRISNLNKEVRQGKLILK